MKKQYLILATFLFLLILSGCGSFMTRTETDVYTIAIRDTTTFTEVKNAPGDRDNGIIYPSSRTQQSERYILRYDSIVERFYPDFIRLGAFESVGLYLSNTDKQYNFNSGLFGIFWGMDRLEYDYKGDSNSATTGGIYRFGIGEWRLRWFQDAKNWTIGTSVIEIIRPDNRNERTLTSVFPLYLRKRFYLHENIPYVAITGAFGLGYFPSQYINLSASIDVGSLGGLNLRLYGGFTAGVNARNSVMVKNSTTRTGQNITFPYVGLGISMLDFINLVPETQQEWKDHSHSSWDIGFIQASVLTSNAEESIYYTDTSITTSKLYKGLILKIANASVALPIPFTQNKFYLGTSLLNFISLGKDQWGLGILPFRLGFLQTVLADELTTEPFIEYNYYPSNIFNIGNRLNLKISNYLNLSLLIGYVNGSTDKEVLGNLITEYIGKPSKISGYYFGIGVGILDQIFFPNQLRYNKNITPIEK